jgi:predicted DCC family thiol-disulfide oxidoreductase YuxK
MKTEFNSVVYFDGVCNLCNFWVKVIKKIDRKSRFELRSLQSIEGQEFIKKYQLESGLVPDSVVYCRVKTSVDLNLTLEPAIHSIMNFQSSAESSVGFSGESLAESSSESSEKEVSHQVYFESDAILQMIKDVGFRGKLVYWLLRLIPLFIRNSVYRWVARNRYRWFGKCDL